MKYNADVITLLCRRAPSPSMRDAIQGMLSMSQLPGDSDLFSKASARRTIRLQQRSKLLDEEEAKLESCYKDDDFGN